MTNKPSGGGQSSAGSEEEMRYALYFTWNDGTKDSFNVNSARERDLNIKEMVARRKEFKEISYCKIYANGEYRDRKYVL